MGRFARWMIVGALTTTLVLVASIALAGTGVGGVFNLGVLNSVDQTTRLRGTMQGPVLKIANGEPGAGATGISVSVQPGSPPFIVDSGTKVANLNADRLDGLTAAAFLRNSVPLVLNGSTAGGGTIAATNTGSGNGVQGIAQGPASGVYGQNDGGGIGVAGRSNQPGGTGVYGEAAGIGGEAGRFNGNVDVNGDLAVTGNVTGVIAGNGAIRSAAVALPPSNAGNFTVIQVPGFFRIGYLCPNPTSGNGVLRLNNFTGDTANMFFDNGSGNPQYQQVPASANFTDQFMNAAGEFVTIGIHSPNEGIATITLFTVNRATDCHAQAQVVMSQ